MSSFYEIVDKLKDILFKELERKLSDKDVAAALGIEYSNFRKQKSRNSIPYYEIMQFLAKRNISINWFFFGQLPETLVDTTSNYILLKYRHSVIGSAGAGAYNYELEDVPLVIDKYLLDYINSNYNYTEVIKVFGDSMEPIIPEGSFIFIDKNNVDITLHDIFAVNTNEGLFIKHIKISDDIITLKSINTDIKDKSITLNDAEIIGKVRGIFTKGIDMENYYSGLDKKIKQNKEKDFVIIKNLTVWSDLLGFGKMFSSSNWNPDISQWETIGKRLKSFYNEHYQNLSPIDEYMFILNDGIVRTFPFKDDIYYNQLLQISYWLRNLVISHTRVNKIDQYGARTVLSYGERFHNSFISEFNTEDFIANYTKKDGNISSYPKYIREHRVMENPTNLQMNTALSKSYILESYGSSKGLTGSHFYIDQSFLEIIKHYVSKSNELYIKYDNNIFAVDHIDSSVVSDGRRYLMGFKLSEPININEETIKTTVYRLDRFYPNDENPDEFCFKLY